MLIRSHTTTLLEIFSEFSLYSQVISKSIRVADDISKGVLSANGFNQFDSECKDAPTTLNITKNSSSNIYE